MWRDSSCKMVQSRRWVGTVNAYSHKGPRQKEHRYRCNSFQSRAVSLGVFGNIVGLLGYVSRLVGNGNVGSGVVLQHQISELVSRFSSQS
jgi:hypothetical protein